MHISADRKRRLTSKARKFGWAAMVPIAAAVGLLTAPAPSSTYFPEQKTCPIGGEKFEFMALGSISTWGALPDGMPIGSGYFPTDLPQCPRNGLVMYRDFNADELEKLKGVIESREYRALRAKDSSKHYLAYQLARALRDEDAPWLLLSATWQAKNDNLPNGRVKAYNDEFASFVLTLPVSATSFNSIALRARAANALRELGRFSEAENLRQSIVIAPEAGGAESDADENRKGWVDYLKLLAGPIARQDKGRSPIDMFNQRLAVSECVSGVRLATSMPYLPEPLSSFEKKYCASPELSEAIAEQKRNLAEYSDESMQAASDAMNAAEAARIEAAALNVSTAAVNAAMAQ